MIYVHSPVLLNEIASLLVGEQDRLFLDCTVGEGGHTEALLKKYDNLRVVGLDRDISILKKAQHRMEPFGERFLSLNLNFTGADAVKKEYGNIEFDCALVDLGISIYHYKESNKGFSFSERQPLDMRLDDAGTSVYDIINGYPYDSLKEIFFKYGEEDFSKEIARLIIKKREISKIEFSDELAAVIAEAIPKKFRYRKTNPATKIFQALRIVANDEIENIKKGIPVILSLLKTGGKLGVITFHSVEDRTVKEIFTYLAKDCVCPPKIPQCICGKKKEVNILHRLIKPSEEEVSKNPPSRSAKLRIVEKIA